MAAVRLDDASLLRAAVAEVPVRPRLLHVRTDREENVELHRRAWEAVREAL